MHLRSCFPKLVSLFVYGLTFVTTCHLPARAQQPDLLNIAAPELVGGPWINTSKNAPIKLAARKGKVTVIHFWTFG